MNKIYTAEELNAIQPGKRLNPVKVDSVKVGQIWSVSLDGAPADSEGNKAYIPLQVVHKAWEHYEDGITHQVVDLMPVYDSCIAKTYLSAGSVELTEDAIIPKGIVCVFALRSCLKSVLKDCYGRLNTEDLKRIQVVESEELVGPSPEWVGTPIVSSVDYRCPWQDEVIYDHQYLSDGVCRLGW